ncbi:MAG: VRR-NUC domain-containing protein [Burkholderiaceae bacterium]
MDRVVVMRGEHEHQVALFRWAALAKQQHPDLGLLFAVPNGGARSKATAGKLKAEGVKAGVPDVVLPIPRNQYGACYIELKVPASAGKAKGRLSPEQRAMCESLRAAGNSVHVCWGWDQARDVLLEYLTNGKSNDRS